MGVPPGAGGPEDNRWPQRPRRMALAVSDDLVDRIVSGEFPVGSSIPKEAELGRHYRASRTVIREAVQAAEAMRLVRAQQGRGTIVRPVDEWDAANPAVLAAMIRHDEQFAILEDLVDLRRAHESQMAAHAAIRATPEDISRITAAYEAAVAAAARNDPDAHMAADTAFHDAVWRASGNRLSRSLQNSLVPQLTSSSRFVGRPTQRDLRSANEGHKKILTRIAAGDPAGAARAMNEHITSSWLKRRPTEGADPRLDAFRRKSA